MTRATNKPTALVAHPIWGRGGAEAAAMWVIDALAHDFDVTVYARGGFDLCELNSLAGTEISPAHLQVSNADRANAWPIGTLAHGAYLRSLRTVGARYDLRVTASGVARWGRPAMHFISSVIWNDAVKAKFEALNSPRRRNVPQLAATCLAALMSGQRFRSLRDDCFVANSRWMACQSAPFCPNPIEVVYPAAPYPAPGLSWDEREAGVLVFGRVSPEKCIENCIEIIERLRATGRHLRLNIVGPPCDLAYEAKIDALCRERRDWIERVPLVTGGEKQRMLGRLRYGLSACKVEAFGIGTAEMAASGMVVLAPESGAQREILQDPLQLYHSADEAVAQFARIIDDDVLQRRLHERAIDARRSFAPEHFTKRVRELAEQFITRGHANGVEPEEIVA